MRLSLSLALRFFRSSFVLPASPSHGEGLVGETSPCTAVTMSAFLMVMATATRFQAFVVLLAQAPDVALLLSCLALSVAYLRRC